MEHAAPTYRAILTAIVMPVTPMPSMWINTPFSATYEMLVISDKAREARVLPVPRRAPHTAWTIPAPPKEIPLPMR
ncbi:hypothetical protein D3C75_724500 [compost metagenome]